MWQGCFSSPGFVVVVLRCRALLEPCRGIVAGTIGTGTLGIEAKKGLQNLLAHLDVTPPSAFTMQAQRLLPWWLL